MIETPNIDLLAARGLRYTNYRTAPICSASRAAFLTERNPHARYKEGSDRDFAAIEWYIVLACYKLGIVLEGTYARACAGKVPADLGERFHQRTIALFAIPNMMISSQAGGRSCRDGGACSLLVLAAVELRYRADPDCRWRLSLTS